MSVFRKKEGMMDRRDSAGCICFDDERVLLIRYFSRFSFPKGHIEEGETREEAALRETEEESGIKAEIVAPPVAVPSQRKGDERNVWFFPSIYVSGEPRGQSGETDGAFWVRIDEAESLLSFEADRKALRKALALFRNSQDRC